MRSREVACSLLVLFAAIPGCGSPTPKMNYGSIELVKAGGKITLDSQPLAGAVVTFENPEDGVFSFGQTDSDGNYQLQFDSVMAGIQPGSKVVRISTTKKIEGLNAEEGEAEGEGAGEGEDGKVVPVPGKGKELVPAKYNKDSELKVEVTSGQTTYDFDLKSN
jgi:hypothetical protein